jgi:hypothetical protein
VLAFALEVAPYVHKEETPVAFATGVVTLAAACLAVAVARSRQSRGWRASWLLAAWLCLLLAVDAALPLSEWISDGTGVRWWKIYALPVAVGLLGWLWAVPLLTRELPLRSPPVRLLMTGGAAWAAAYGVRLIAYASQHGRFAYLNDHVLPPELIVQLAYVLEAVLKFGGAALLVLALAQVRVRMRSSRPMGVA